MAFKMDSSAQVLFFEKLFGLNHPLVAEVKELITKGVSFATGLYDVKATSADGKVFQCSVTKSTPALMKGEVDSFFIEQNRALVLSFHISLYQLLLNKPSGLAPKAEPVTPPEPVTYTLTASGVLPSFNYVVAIKAIRDITGWDLKYTKTVVDHLKGGQAVTLKPGLTQAQAFDAFYKLMACEVLAAVFSNTGDKINVPAKASEVFKEKEPEPEATVSINGTPAGEVTKVKYSTGPLPPKPQPIASIINLRDAQALGQKVNGTSPGSVYYCVGISKNVRVAVKIVKHGSMSFRAEWPNPLSPDDKQRLSESGISLKGSYGSMHLSAEGVPFGRVVGAFLLGTGIKWEQVVTCAADLVVQG